MGRHAMPPVPEDLGDDDNGNHWARTQAEYASPEDPDDGDFTLGFTVTIPDK